MALLNRYWLPQVLLLGRFFMRTPLQPNMVKRMELRTETSNFLTL
jgi:hypothetical protein